MTGAHDVNPKDFAVSAKDLGAQYAYGQTATIGDRSLTKGGLTKRELFAAMAMQGMVSANDSTMALAFKTIATQKGISVEAMIAQSGVELADALLAELAKEPQP